MSPSAVVKHTHPEVAPQEQPLVILQDVAPVRHLPLLQLCPVGQLPVGLVGLQVGPGGAGVPGGPGGPAIIWRLPFLFPLLRFFLASAGPQTPTNPRPLKKKAVAVYLSIRPRVKHPASCESSLGQLHRQLIEGILLRSVPMFVARVVFGWHQFLSSTQGVVCCPERTIRLAHAQLYTVKGVFSIGWRSCPLR